MSSGQKSNTPVPTRRINNELYRAPYNKQSNLGIKDVRGQYTRSIGDIIIAYFRDE